MSEDTAFIDQRNHSAFLCKYISYKLYKAVYEHGKINILMVLLLKITREPFLPG